MLISASELLHRVNVQAAFVREGGEADVRRTNVMRHIGEFIHEMGELAEVRQINAEQDAHLDLEVRHDGDEVAVPDAFTVAIDGALHLAGSRTHSSECIGHADAAVVMRVNAHGLAEMGDGLLRDLFDEFRQGSAIRFAEHHEVCAGIGSGFDGLERVIGIFAEAVEEVLGIIQHLATVLFEVSDRIRDHREVFLQSDLEDFRDMQRPGFAHDGHGGRFRIQKHFDLRIVLDLHFPTAGHAKGGDPGGFPGALRGFFKESGVLGV